jgi:hypothetical protein
MLSLLVLLDGSLALAIDPRFELDPSKLQQKIPPKPPEVTQTKEPASPKAGHVETSKKAKPSDAQIINSHKKLIEAKQPDTGKHVVSAKKAKRVDRMDHPVKARMPKPAENRTTGHNLALFKGSPDTVTDGIENAKLVWEKLIPAQKRIDESFSIKEKTYSLNLSPNRFPLFPAADGGKILVEARGKLSPLVKSLIQQHDKGIRFVTYDPQNRKRFFANLLSSAGFYSVEEDFKVAFGSDPKLTVSTDFKVENDSNSPLQHDIFLFNTDQRTANIPAPLSEYLTRQGFRVINLYPHEQKSKPLTGSSINVITDKDPSVVADKLMSALSLGYQQEKEIEVFSIGEGGIGLQVKADRYFEKNGEKFIVSTFKGDPENYTLLRLLESQHYRVIVLMPDDDFHSVAGKILSQLGLPSNYSMRDIISSKDIPYTIQMSGIMLSSDNKRDKIFLTGSKPGRLIGELLELNGYAIQGSKEEIVNK